MELVDSSSPQTGQRGRRGSRSRRPLHNHRNNGIVRVTDEKLQNCLWNNLVSTSTNASGFPVFYKNPSTGEITLGTVLENEGTGTLLIEPYPSGDFVTANPVSNPGNLDHLISNWMETSKLEFPETGVAGLPDNRVEFIQRILICVRTGLQAPATAILTIKSKRNPGILELPVIIQRQGLPSTKRAWQTLKHRMPELEHFDVVNAFHLYLNVKDGQKAHYLKFVVDLKDGIECLQNFPNLYFATPGDAHAGGVASLEFNRRDAHHIRRMFHEKQPSYYTTLIPKPDGSWEWEDQDKTKTGVWAYGFHKASSYANKISGSAVVQVWDAFGRTNDPVESDKLIKQCMTVSWHKPLQAVPVAPAHFTPMSTGYDPRLPRYDASDIREPEVSSLPPMVMEEQQHHSIDTYEYGPSSPSYEDMYSTDLSKTLNFDEI